MSIQNGFLILYNKEKNQYYQYRVKMTNGESLEVFSNDKTKDAVFVKEKQIDL